MTLLTIVLVLLVGIALGMLLMCLCFYQALTTPETLAQLFQRVFEHWAVKTNTEFLELYDALGERVTVPVTEISAALTTEVPRRIYLQRTRNEQHIERPLS